MRSGLKALDVVTGTGPAAEKKSQVLVHVRGLLSKGDVFLDTRQDHKPIRIELGKRECIAGLRYGIVGMQVGGRRELIVSPHLGYGAQGLQGKIPPDAALRFEVELLEVRPAGLLKTDDHPPGRQIYFLWPGEIRFNRPRVQLGLEEGGRCGIAVTLAPQTALTWRHAVTRSVECHLNSAETIALFDEVETLPQKNADACVNNDSLWADSSEKANSVTRDLTTNTACVTIGISERGGWHCYYSIRQDHPVLHRSKLFGLVNSLIEQTRGQK